MNVYFSGDKWKVFFDYYTNGNHRLRLKSYNTTKIIEASIDAPLKLSYGEVLIKNYSENQGIEEALIYGNIIKEGFIKNIDCGFTSVKSYQISTMGLNLLNYQRINNIKAEDVIL